jgi:hypothetical protein
VTNEFGLFVNLDYAHKSQDECSLIWQNIMDAMLEYGFLFKNVLSSFAQKKVEMKYQWMSDIYLMIFRPYNKISIATLLTVIF